MKSKSESLWDLIMDKQSQVTWLQIEIASEILRKLIDIHIPESKERDAAMQSLNEIQMNVMNSLLKRE